MPDAPKTLDYRPAPPSRVRVWMREHAAEWLVGLGWTFCGCGGLIIALGWLFVSLEPRSTPAGVFSWIGLSIAGAGVLMAVASLAFGALKDGILRVVLMATLVLGATVFTFGLLLPGRQEAPLRTQPLPSSAFEGEGGDEAQMRP